MPIAMRNVDDLGDTHHDAAQEIKWFLFQANWERNLWPAPESLAGIGTDESEINRISMNRIGSE